MKKNYVILISLLAVTILLVGFLMYRFPHTMDSSDNIAHMVWATVLLAGLIPAALFHFGTAPVLKYGAAWAGIFLVLLVGYSYQDELWLISGRVKENLFPFSPTQTHDGSVRLLRTNDGHFRVEALVNHVPVQFMIDTGASQIALTMADAKRVGINVESLSFVEPIHTANGLTFAAPVYLREIQIGPIVVKDISATVNQNLYDHSLLGMNFLKKLKGFRFEGNSLTLEGPQSP